MRKLIYLPFILLFCSATFHTEQFFICSISENSNELNYTIHIPLEKVTEFDKTLNKKEGSINETLKIRQLLEEKLIIKINGTETFLRFENTSSDSRFMRMVFKSNRPASIESLAIKNNGFEFGNDGHKSIDFWITINQQKRLFKLNKKHQSIKANY
jgi:hypothetical protein